MRLTEHVYLVGSGGPLGFGLSDDYDCHIYCIDGGTELALIDAGAGRDIGRVVERMQFDGLEPARLRHLLLTHGHTDHAGGAAAWHGRFGAEVAAAPETAAYLREANEEKISLAFAKRAGVYPEDYQFRACPVARELREGDTVRIGCLTLTALETPGHSSGHIAYLLDEGGQQILFAGDAIFHGGRIVLQNIWDCDLQAQLRTVGKLAALSIDALLPGHMALALSQGHRHIQQALAITQRLLVPPQLI